MYFSNLPNWHCRRKWNVSGKVIEVRSELLDNGNKVQIWDRYTQNGLVPGAVQEWFLIPAGRLGTEMSYFIFNKQYEKYLDSRLDGGAVTVRAADNSANQKWLMQTLEGKVTYMNAETNSVLTRTGTTNGSIMTLKTLSFAATQRFLKRPSSNPFISILHVAPRARGDVGAMFACADSPSLFLTDDGSAFTLRDRNATTQSQRTFQAFHPQTSCDFGTLSNNGDLGSLSNPVPGTVIGKTNSVEPPASRQLWYIFESKVPFEYYIVNAEFGLALTVDSPVRALQTMRAQLLGTAGARQRWKFIRN